MGVSLLYVLSVPVVWRGETVDVSSTRTAFEVNARNFPVFVMFLGRSVLWLQSGSVRL